MFLTYLSFPVVRQNASAESRVAMIFALEVLCPRPARYVSIVAFLPSLSRVRNSLQDVSPPLAPLLDGLEHPIIMADVAMIITSGAVIEFLIVTLEGSILLDGLMG